MADANIPRFRAERAAVPGTYDKDRRPGSSGQRYFSDMRYANPNMAPRVFDDEASGYETQAAYDTRFDNSMDAAIDAARDTNTAQANQLGIANLANPARGTRPSAQTLSDAEVLQTFTGIQNNPAYDTERKAIEQRIGAMNQYNISPQRASEVMNVPLADIKAMMSPYYTAYGETKPEGIANLIGAQEDLVAAADERLPYMTPKQQGLYESANNASNMGLAQLIEMGFFTPEQAAQFGYMGYAQGGNVNGYYLGGATDGMADQIPAAIDNRQPAALSDGEFVIPADVVSHLGNGNSNAGATELYGMMDKIRKARTGNTSQGREINPNKFLA